MDQPIEFKEETHQYFCNGLEYPSVTQIIKAAGLVDDAWFTNESRDRGRYVHSIIEWDQAGELDEESVDVFLTGYLDAWKRFVADTGFVSELSEYRMVSEMYRVAGTADQIGILNGKKAIIDVKSGAVSPCVSLQLAGYELLWNSSVKRFALQLKDDGKYSLKEYTDRGDRSVFIAAAALYHWKQLNMGRG